MQELSVDVDLSFSKLMDLYGGILNNSRGRKKKGNVLLGKFDEGRNSERMVYESVKSGSPTLRYTHGRTDFYRVGLQYFNPGGSDSVIEVGFLAKPDFVFQSSDEVTIVDNKLGDPFPAYLIQAMVVRYIYLSRYGIEPLYYLLTNDRKRLWRLSLDSGVETSLAFNSFCIGCIAESNLVLRKKGGWGALFGNDEEVAWQEVLGESDPKDVAINSFNLISQLFPSLIAEEEKSKLTALFSLG